MINVRTLSKRHGDRRVLDGVSAEVTKGETIAIVGPSGGGKSTLLRCLNYLETFDEGTVEICGLTLTPNIHRGDGRLRGVHLPLAGEDIEVLADFLRVLVGVDTEVAEVAALPAERNVQVQTQWRAGNGR